MGAVAAWAAPPCRESLKITIGFLGILLWVAVRMGLMPLPGAGDDVMDGRVVGFPLEVFAGFVYGGDERGRIACAGGVVFGGNEATGDFAAGLKDFQN